MSHRYGDDQGYWIDACAKCGREGPVVKGEIEPCVQRFAGSLVLSLCRACRDHTTVAEAFRLLSGHEPPPPRISLLDRIEELARRILDLERRNTREEHPMSDAADIMAGDVVLVDTGAGTSQKA